VDVNAFTLLDTSFLEASGYDIACPKQYTYIYQILNGKPTVKPYPSCFHKKIFTLFTSIKQNSKAAINTISK
jgi:hypothetical protein